jgi:hypothetical protein
MGTVTAWRPPPRSFADVRDPEGDPSYPVALLEGCETALVLFAAAFWGRQDAAHIADAGLTATCVDLDRQKLDEMRRVYPDDWTFVDSDAFEYAKKRNVPFDIVSLDPFTNLMARCADELPLWCSLATRAVILGSGSETWLRAPDGWDITDTRHRSDFNGGIFWTVLEPA